MGMFGSLSERLNHIFSKLTRRGKLTELEIKESMREIRVALLEADVNFLVVKDLVNKITEKAIGQKVMESLTPGQMVVKIVNEELVELMGSTNQKLQVASNPPTIIMMCGLQGAGKTTMCGKLGLMLKKQGKKPLLVACDIYRPAAINQLKVLGKSIDVPVFDEGVKNVCDIAKNALEYAKKYQLDTVIVDTAGRLQIDETLMQELKDLKSAINPTEILLTVDSMTGQEAVNVAQSFNNDLDITGVILTKLDGDTRGGAALSIKAVTGKPIKFSGIGEKLTDIEPFYPDRMASRILGMGDVLTLIEKAQEAVDEKQMLEMERKFKENSFDFNDFLQQYENVKKMGDLKGLLSMIPGLGSKLKNIDIDENQIAKNKAIIQSMTEKERSNPEIIKSSQRQRIAKGSGSSIQEVNQLMKQFEQTKEMMKQMKNGKGLKNFRF